MIDELLVVFVTPRLEKHLLGVVVENLGEFFRIFSLHAGDHFEYLAKNRHATIGDEYN